MERATSFEQLSDVLGLVTHTFCPIAPNFFIAIYSFEISLTLGFLHIDTCLEEVTVYLDFKLTVH